MFYKSYFVANYCEICDKLTDHLTAEGKRYQLAVVVFANANAEFAKTHVLPHISYWNYRSKDDVDFFFVGYLGDSSDSEFSPIIDHESEFHEQAFVETIEQFEQESAWQFSGQCSIIITRAQLLEHRTTKKRRAFLDFSSVIEFDLERAQRDQVIESVHAFFEALIRSAREQKDANPEWHLSDKFNGRALGTALIDATYSKLPGFVRKAVSALDYFRIKDKTSPNEPA